MDGDCSTGEKGPNGVELRGENRKKPGRSISSLESEWGDETVFSCS